MVEEKGKEENFESRRWNFEVFDIRISNDIENVNYDEWNQKH